MSCHAGENLPIGKIESVAVVVVKDSNVVGYVSRKIVEDLVIAYLAVSKPQLLA